MIQSFGHLFLGIFLLHTYRNTDHLIHYRHKMAVVLSNVNSEAGLQKLNDHLLTRSYMTGYVIYNACWSVIAGFLIFASIGLWACILLYLTCFRYQASKDDMAVFAALTSAPPSSYVNVTRWYDHISALLRSRCVLELPLISRPTVSFLLSCA